MIQEALTNVFRHSGASKGHVTLIQDDKQLLLTVRDDGKGISEDISRFRLGSIGVGIGGMRERVREFGGELGMANANPGTLIEVIIPCDIPVREAIPSY